MNERNNREIQKNVFQNIQSLINPPEFYNLSYNDLLYIKNSLNYLDHNLKDRFADIEERIKSVKNEYRLKNYHYQQNYPETCAIACYMMAISNYLRNGFRPNKNTETALFLSFDKRITITKILRNALKDGFRVKIFSETDYPNIQYKGEMAENLRINFVRFLDENQNDKSLDINFNVPLQENILRNCLNNGESILVNGTYNSIPHMRLVSGYINDSFLISDPLKRRKEIMSFKNLKEISNPPLGEFYFSLKSEE